MKSVSSAALALVLLAGSGCCGYPQGCTLFGPNCESLGCGDRFRHNWSRCRDCCDDCGNWSGPAISSQAGGWHNQPQYQYTDEMASEGTVIDESEQGYRVVPGSKRVTVRSGEPTPAAAADKPARPRRVTKSRTVVPQSYNR